MDENDITPEQHAARMLMTFTEGVRDNARTLDTLTDAAGKSLVVAGAPVTTEAVHYAVVPDGCSIRSLEDYQFSERPRIKVSHKTLVDVSSFVAYWNLFADPESRLFANPTKRKFHAIFDHHESGPGGLPRWGHFTADLTLRTSDEWNTWNTSNNVQMDQTKFAFFIEDNVTDILRGASMLEAARSLKAKSNVEFGSQVNLANGAAQFHYSETISGRVGGGEIEVPEGFSLVIPVFQLGLTAQIDARLRWRITAEKKLMFWYSLIRPAKLLQEAFNEAVEQVSVGTSADVLLAEI